MLDIIVRTDGVYDIFCALCILDVIQCNSYYLRLSNFNIDINKELIHSNRFPRFYAYLLIVNGIVKIHYDWYLVTSIYGIESIVFFNELLNYSVSERGVFNSFFSMFLCTYVFLNKLI